MTFCINANINEQSVSIVFDWSGHEEDCEPNWDTIEIQALLKAPKPLEGSYWVLVNKLLSDDDWVKIEKEIYTQWKTLKRK